MRKTLLTAFIAMFTVLTAQASEIVLIESKLEQMRTEIEVQMERIQWAQETAEARMSVAGTRVEEQLSIAEEELATQVEKLEMLRDQLKDQIQEADRAIRAIREDWKVTMTGMYERIRSQISEANIIIQRLRQLRSKSNTATGQASLLPAISGGIGNGTAQLDEQGLCPGGAPLTNDSPTLTVDTAPDLAPTTLNPTPQGAPGPVALLPPTPMPTSG